MIILQGDNFYSKREQLEKVKADNWNIYYIDLKSKEKWIEEYPLGEMHGGGPPQLRRLDKFPWE